MVNRTQFYEYKKRIQEQGLVGLKDLPPILKTHPQTTPPKVVERGDAQPGKVKAARDIQLDVDLGAERIVLEAIQTAFPGDQILSEEAGGAAYTTGRRWIVDPLDGSFNFQHGYPLFGTIIALQVDQVTTLGVIYLPTSDEMYTAIRGQGAFRNGSPLRASSTSTLSEAIVHVSDFSVTGEPADNQQRVHVMTALAGSVGRVRMGGTAAGDFAWLAAGWADGLVMYSTHPRDVEAGALMVEEAGGIVTRDYARWERRLRRRQSPARTPRAHRLRAESRPLSDLNSPADASEGRRPRGGTVPGRGVVGERRAARGHQPPAQAW